MSNIVRTAVQSSLRNHRLGGYQSQAEPVIVDLQAGLDRAVVRLVQHGRRLGATEQQVKDALIDAGLLERPAPPAPPAAPRQDDGHLDRLTRWARGLGFRG